MQTMTYHFDTDEVIKKNIWIDHLIKRIISIKEDIQKYKNTQNESKNKKSWQDKIDECLEVLEVNLAYFKKLTGRTYDEYIKKVSDYKAQSN